MNSVNRVCDKILFESLRQANKLVILSSKSLHILSFGYIIYP